MQFPPKARHVAQAVRKTTLRGAYLISEENILVLRAKFTNFVISTGFSKDFGLGKSNLQKALMIDIQNSSGIEISGVYEKKSKRHMPNFFCLLQNNDKYTNSPGS